VVSRTHPGLIKRLFELEVPEIADGVVEIKACAREPGHRTKIAVWSNDANVDPVGACVGARGARVRMVVNELQGEKIDIVPFSADSPDFVAKALSPAKVKEVRIDEYEGRAEVIVPDYQLSLAIGKEGQNARLAARLTGWRVDIKSETQLAEEESYKSEEWAQGEWIIDPVSGEQVWQPADGGDAMSAEQWKTGDPIPDPDGDGVPGADEVEGAAATVDNEATEVGGPDDPLEVESEPSPEEQAMHVETEPDVPPAPTDDPAAEESSGEATGETEDPA
jgi:transcription termination/antitermination protein NusA